MTEKITNKFTYEGIIDEQQGNRLCLKYKGYEAIKRNPKILSFFVQYRKRGVIEISDEDMKKMLPYSMEGKKARVTIEIVED